MTDHDPRPNDAAADDNVERLIGRSYRPDAPDPAFVARVEDRLLAAARDRQGDAPPAPGLRLLSRLAAAAAAAALLAAVVGLGRLVDGSRPSAEPTPREVAQALARAPHVPDGPVGLGPRALAPPPEPARVADGDVLRTGAAERRRVTLPDGSVLYVDSGTEVAVEGARVVRVQHGSVYVEVQPDPEHPFRVLTPTRELTALGTRFAVDVDGGATSLLVTHGRVAAAGVERVVRTGERLVERDGVDVIEAAGRTSHSIEWTRDLIAAAASPLVPSSDFEGGALVALDPWGQETRLSLRRYHVDVHIQDGFARTTIDQTYFNHAHWRLEGTFYFPLPADASLSRLAMYVAGVRMEGGMTERDRARDVYEQIVHRRKDPALLEWVDGSTFKMRVFPLEPREEKRILLSYVQRLPALYGESTYRFPAARDLGIVDDWSFQARVVGGATWRSDSHVLSESRDSVDLVLGASEKGVLMDDDVVLRLHDLSAPSAGATSFRSFEQDGCRYLMVRHRPDLAAQRAPERRDWIFLVETSGSRDPVVARAQVELVREMLALAEKDDRFALVTAATRTTTLSDDLLAVTPENVSAALEMLEGSHLIGALDLRRALSATRPFAAEAENAVVVHVGSGVSTMGERDPGTLARLVPEGAAYVGVAVGRQWSRPFMKQAAARSGGLYTQVDPTEPLRWRAFDLRATLDTPRVLDAKVVDDAEKATFLGFEDTAAHGEEIVAVTRVPAGEAYPSRVTLAGKLGGRAWSRTVTVDGVRDGAGYLPRQWARLEIERLLADDAQAHRDEVVALSKAMYVMSPFTSLLVLEDEKMYEQFGVDRGRSDHWALYPAPDEIPVVREPDGAPAKDAPEGAVDVDRLLGTILVRVPPYLLQTQNGQWDWRTAHAGGTYTLHDLRQWARAYGAVPHDMMWYSAWTDGERTVDVDADGRVDVVDVIAALRESQSQQRWNLWGGGGLRREAGDWFGQPIGIGGGSGGRFLLQSSSGFDFSSAVAADSYLLGGVARSGDPLRGLGYLPYSGASAPIFTYGRDFSTLFGAPFDDRRISVLFSTRDEPVSTGRLAFGFLEVGARSSFGGSGGGSGNAGWGSSPSDGPWPASSSRPVMLPGLYLGAYRGPAGEVPPDSREPSDPPPPPEALEFGLLARIQQGTLYQTLQYQRPWVNNDQRYFADLLAFAPGMNTTSADVAQVIEEEGGRPARRGTVDDGAARLIARARSAGWRRVQIDGPNGFDLAFDGAGRFRMERTLPIGLREIVVGDGTQLRHLYPEIGVGAVRQMSRHHRGMLAGIAPWLLGPVEDLAVGADVRLVDDRTIDVVPLGESAYRLRLVFADGRLVERRLMKGDDVLVRQSFAYSETGVEVSARADTATEESVSVEDRIAPVAAEPDLVPDVSALVVLPLPYRTRQHVWNARGMQAKGEPETWSEEDALAVLSADFGTVQNEAEQIVDLRFVARGDKRLGLHAILLAGGLRWDVTSSRKHGDKRPVLRDPRTAHPESPLAHYVAACANRDGNADLVLPVAMRDGFLGDLAATATEIARWTSGRGGDGSQIEASRDRTLAVAGAIASPELRWAVLSTFWNYVGMDQRRAARMAELLEPLTDVPGLAYHARYDRAVALSMVGHDAARKEALDEFLALHATALENGILPAVDGNFLSSVRNGDAERWRAHWLAAAQTLTLRGSRGALPYAGLQLHWMGDAALGDELIAMALDGCPEEQRLAATLSTVEVRWTLGRYRPAEQLVEGLLADERLAKSATLWTLGAYLADAQGAVARGVLRQERALEIAFDDLPDIVDLSVVRQEYGALLARFQQLATAVQALGGDVPDTVISRVVRAADRWRALDDDPTAACQSAARILRTLGADDLAWDYLTTPLGARPNEGAPWSALAQQLQQEGDIDLADRCYATAFEIEPTDAQILWDRAEMLRGAGRLDAAREVWRTLADGDWQPRFQWIRDQARLRLR